MIMTERYITDVLRHIETTLELTLLSRTMQQQLLERLMNTLDDLHYLSQAEVSTSATLFRKFVELILSYEPALKRNIVKGHI